MKFLAVFLLVLSSSAFALVGGHQYQFDNEIDDVRFRILAAELRCPKCQNQNLSDSNSPVAADLRDELYRMVKEGHPDQQIMEFMVSRYGEFVRYRPEVSQKTWVLWYGPAILVVFGIIIVLLLGRRGQKKSKQPRSVDKQRLQSLLDDEENKS